MRDVTIGDFNITVQNDSLPYLYYHRAIYWPTWVESELPALQNQITLMSPKTKSLKMTATAKLQMGYPHEVSSKHKSELYAQGVHRDHTSNSQQRCIPKLTLEQVQGLWTLPNIIATSTPPNSTYLRDVTLVDRVSDDKLVFCYVLSRRAQILTAWSEEKTKNGNWQPRPPNNFSKLLSLQTKPLNN